MAIENKEIICRPHTYICKKNIKNPYRKRRIIKVQVEIPVSKAYKNASFFLKINKCK